MMSKIKVNGPGGMSQQWVAAELTLFFLQLEAYTLLAAAEPLYDFLKSQQGGVLTNDVKWNFTKFLVDKDGEVVKR